MRDSFAAMAYVLAGIAARGQSLSKWVDELPQYTIVKDKLTCPRERSGSLYARHERTVTTPPASAEHRSEAPDGYQLVR